MQVRTPRRDPRYSRSTGLSQSEGRALYVTNNSLTGGSVSCLTRPPDLREEDEEVVKVAEDGAEVVEEEEELNSEACMEILQEALEEAAAAPQPHKYQPEPGGSQVLS